MADLHVATTRGVSIVLSEAIVQGFKTRLRGPLLCPGDAGYKASAGSRTHRSTPSCAPWV
jgi:hypothetical protein